jgi:hypothetical protein
MFNSAFVNFVSSKIFFMAEIKGKKNIQINCDVICVTSVEEPNVLYNSMNVLDK